MNTDITKCFVQIVPLWEANNCTNLVSALSVSDKTAFFTKLFNDFYSNFTPNSVFVPGYSTTDNNISSGIQEIKTTDSNLNFQYLLADLCGTRDDSVAIGGISCLPSLNILCNAYSRSDLENPNIRRMCGCYLSDINYNQNISRTCDPVCSSIDTIKYFTTSNTPVQCNENVCIIDNVTLNLQQSSIGELTFNQICPACSTGNSCNCIISDVNIINTDSAISQINFKQDCGNNSTCYQRNTDGTQAPVDCNVFFNSIGPNAEDNTKKKQFYLGVALAILFVIFILVIFVIGYLWRE